MNKEEDRLQPSVWWSWRSCDDWAGGRCPAAPSTGGQLVRQPELSAAPAGGPPPPRPVTQGTNLSPTRRVNQKEEVWEKVGRRLQSAVQ